MLLSFNAKRNILMFLFGAIADVQFADLDDDGENRHRSSIGRLRASLAEILKRSRQGGDTLLFQCGDLIESAGAGPDADLVAVAQAEFDFVLKALSEFPGQLHHVLGNHCLKRSRSLALRRLGQPAFYYFARPVAGACDRTALYVVLDALDESPLAESASSAEAACQGQRRLAHLEKEGAAHAVPWNGAIGEAQLHWLQTTLSAPEHAAVTFVFVFTHVPLCPQATSERHLLYNHEQVRDVLERHAPPDATLIVLAGHFHAGGYHDASSGSHSHDGRPRHHHHITIPAILTSQAAVGLTVMTADDEGAAGALTVSGFGPEMRRLFPPDGNLIIRKANI